MGKADDGDWIDKVAAIEKVPRNRRPKHKLTVQIDYGVWDSSVDELGGKYGLLLEAAIVEYMRRIGKPIDPTKK